MSGTAAAAERVPVPALPGDAVAEILARVQPPDMAFLFRCALVCKRWLHVLSDPDVIRRLLPDAAAGRPSSLLLGFFADRLPPTAEPTEIPSPPLLPAFVPAPGSALGPGDQYSLASFVRDDAGVLDHAELLAAHDGLILLRVVVPAGDHDALRLCVCNLHTGRLDLLPPLLNTAALFDGKGVRGYAVLSAADENADAPHRPADGYSTFFQVLLIAVHHGDNQMYLHRFSSTGGNWIATPTNFFPHDRSWRAPIPDDSFRQFWTADSFRQRQTHLSQGCRAATVCCGAAHWLFKFEGNLYIHHVSLKTWQLGTTRVLIDVLINWCNARLCSSVDGRLSFVYVSDDYLVTWTQRDRVPDYSFGWVLDGFIVVNMQRWRSRARSLATMCFGEKTSTVLVLYDSDPDSAYLFDFRSRFPSKSSTKVTSWNESLNHVVVPYEVDCPRFFMSRLGTQM